MDLPSGVSNVESTFTRAAQAPFEISLLLYMRGELTFVARSCICACTHKHVICNITGRLAKQAAGKILNGYNLNDSVRQPGLRTKQYVSVHLC